MRQGIKERHGLDRKGNPAGGSTTGVGLSIVWQDGPLGRGPSRKHPNGAFVEDVLDAVLGRLEFYQCTRFKCIENATAIEHIQVALRALEERTRRRESEGTEGTHEGS